MSSIRIGTDLLLKILEETPSSQNIMLMGKHGIGKSQIIENFYSAKGYKVVTLFLGQMSDPGDLIGIPSKNEATGKTDFLPPYWFPLDNTPVVLFLDELNRARPEVLQTIMDLALNRKLAGKSLPEGSRIISAVNNGEEYELTQLDPALISRFNIYQFAPTSNDWITWAENNQIDRRIINFIKENPEKLDSQQKNDEDDSFEKTPDRRGWSRVSEIIIGKSKLDLETKAMIAGIIGKRVAAEFVEYANKAGVLLGSELLLGNFDELKSTLDSYKTPELCVLSISIFNYLENTKKSNKEKELCALNLNKYYEFLENKKLTEAMAYLVKIFSSTGYPNCLSFIITECSELYTKMTQFAGKLK